MARNNFQYEKRQRELDKKRKAEEKARRKQEAKNMPAGAEATDGATEGDADGAEAQPGLERTAPAATPSMS